MPLETLRWLVLVVVLYAAGVMFRASLLGRKEERVTAPVVPVVGAG